MLCLVAGGPSFNAFLYSENKAATVICTRETPTITAAEPMEAAQRLSLLHDPNEQTEARRMVALEAADWACVVAVCCQHSVCWGGQRELKPLRQHTGAHNTLTRGEGPFDTCSSSCRCYRRGRGAMLQHVLGCFTLCVPCNQWCSHSATQGARNENVQGQREEKSLSPCLGQALWG